MNPLYYVGMIVDALYEIDSPGSEEMRDVISEMSEGEDPRQYLLWATPTTYANIAVRLREISAKYPELESVSDSATNATIASVMNVDSCEHVRYVIARVEHDVVNMRKIVEEEKKTILNRIPEVTKAIIKYMPAARPDRAIDNVFEVLSMGTDPETRSVLDDLICSYDATQKKIEMYRMLKRILKTMKDRFVDLIAGLDGVFTSIGKFACDYAEISALSVIHDMSAYDAHAYAGKYVDTHRVAKQKMLDANRRLTAAPDLAPVSRIIDFRSSLVDCADYYCLLKDFTARA